MPSALTQVGAYPLTGTGKLPNVGIASPGEVWTNKRADGEITPGTLVKPVLVSTIGSVQAVAGGDTIVNDGDGIRKESLAIACRQVMVPDINPGSQFNPALGPNEIMNLQIADKDWVRTLHTGVVNLTLVVPDSGYKEGDILGWDPEGARPAGKHSGEGAWAKITHANVVAGTGILIVHAAPRYYGSANEAVLTARFLRANQ